SWIARQLKRGKAFEPNKINGLLVVSLDANEQFCSDHRPSTTIIFPRQRQL
ncbi:MAG: hypothetical protein QG637_991, partial [Chloroflexota bacterium]|nr:hypothetical protein [Chloroflexota bacterium]